jgi:hypothetical protein
MDPAMIDSIDIVIAGVTAQPIASKSVSERTTRSGEINLSASNVTIVPHPTTPFTQQSVRPAIQFGTITPANSYTFSSDSVSSYGDINPSQSQLIEAKENKEGKEIKEYNDEQVILEALSSAKDRLFMLKLGDSMENLIAERQYVSHQQWRVCLLIWIYLL